MFYPTKTMKITENIYAIRTFFVNFFVYVDGEDYIVIDTGLSKFLAKRGLKKLGINPEDISHIFLTHTDYDHVGGINLFKNAEVYLSKDEEQMINGTTARAFRIKYNRLNKPYKLLKDNEEIYIGKIKVKSVSTPGHTPGSMTYIINDSVIFSGDTLTLRKNKVYPFYWLQNMDTKKQKESIIDFIENNDCNWVFTSHTGYSDNFKNGVKNLI
ncbi:MAG: MBL fold metallo-hydrolase [Firmicutes bacterium]|nr:MBL fold metallo-hydrolase [Bacillota bacterium]